MPVPVPVNETGPAVVVVNESLPSPPGNVSAAVNASAAAGGAASAGGGGVGNALGKLVTGLASGGGDRTGLIVMATFVILAAAVLFPLLAIFIRRRLGTLLGQPSFKMPWVFYDPTENKLSYTVLYRIAPNVYAHQDGEYIALARHQSKPLTLDLPLDKNTLRENGRNALYGVKIGDLVFNTSDVDEVKFALFGEEIGGTRELGQLLLLLREQGIINDITISPNMRLIVSANKEDMARYLSRSIGDLAADTMVDVAAMTGTRQEFQAWVRQLVELEKQRIEAATKAVSRIIVIVFVVIFVLGLLLYGLASFIR